MRLLHTSDWHLGRGLHGLDLHDAQVKMVQQLSTVVSEYAVDAVIVAGDVFDRAVPPVAAVRLWGDALRPLAEQVPVIVVSGNHDSAVRLGSGADLYRDGVHLCTEISDVGRPVLLSDENGPVAIYPIPFLDPDLARHSLRASDEPLERSHAAVLAEAMNRVRSDLEKRRASNANTRSVVVAHAFVTAGAPPEKTDSERDIRVGGVDSVPVSVFDGVDYVALGHLHGAQKVDADRVRYSGSPLRYSFSEARQRKQVLLVDLGDQGVTRVESVPLDQPRDMAVLGGTLDELLTSAELDQHVESWVQVTVTDTERPSELRSRLLDRFPHALSIRHEPLLGPLAAGTPADVRVPSEPDEVVAAFVHYVTGGHITDDELRAFADAYEHAQREGANA
ncbi:MAG: exonuclease SbcCD subunit D [Actinomycetes bacterium]